MTELYLDKSKVSFYAITETAVEAIIGGTHLCWFKEQEAEQFELIKSKLKGIKND